MMRFLKSGSGHSMARLLMAFMVGSVCYAVVFGRDISTPVASVLTAFGASMAGVWGISKWRKDA